MNLPTTVLDPMVEHYLQHWRALGRAYSKDQRVLESLRQFLSLHGVADLDQKGFDAWSRTFTGLSANVRRERQRMVHKFCLFRQRSEPNCFVPDINRFARPVPCALPTIFGDAEVARMLAACQQLRPHPHSPLLPYVMRLAIVLLYTAGLRRGELPRLTLADVNASDGILHIRESKHHKSRFVPLSADASRELQQYLKRRLAPPFSATPDSPLLCHLHRKGCLQGFTVVGFGSSVRKLLRASGVRSAEGSIPRIMDFRHSFAIGALLRWYRQGSDVQVQLPKLAMYMGHVSILSTAHYLRWIPALAEAANKRFESQFGHLIDGGAP